ncbi:MAG: hypothetical protein BMS9Abin37_1726 [Acidobacteriota bacterium]|nr:MAG: hypothetical protein BMS9Abin37_1726 [Acidobacteriota bacterium]
MSYTCAAMLTRPELSELGAPYRTSYLSDLSRELGVIRSSTIAWFEGFDTER